MLLMAFMILLQPKCVNEYAIKFTTNTPTVVSVEDDDETI